MSRLRRRWLWCPCATAREAALQLRKLELVLIVKYLTDFGRAAPYAHLADLPVYLLPGNHDDRDQMRRSFPDHDWLGQEGEFIQYSVQVGQLRLIALDTSSSGARGSHVYRKVIRSRRQAQ